MANIRDHDLAAYLNTFHDTYRQTVESLIPAEIRHQLVRLTMLDTGIQGYISTQNGAAYEYIPGTAPGVSVRHGSAPIEDLVFDIPAFLRRRGELAIEIADSLRGTIQNLRFEDILPIRLRGNSSVRLVEVIAKARDWHRHISFAELTTDRSTEYWSLDNAVRRAKDELLIAVIDLREHERKVGVDFETFLRTAKQRYVLLCGDFKEGRDRLAVIRETLLGEGYQPLLLDEIDEELFGSQDLPQKFLAVAPNVRFVVIDDSSRGGQMVELHLAHQNHLVTLVMRLRGTEAGRSYMTAGAGATSSVLREVDYGDDMRQVIHEGCAWAEDTLERLERTYRKAFPWRDPENES